MLSNQNTLAALLWGQPMMQQPYQQNQLAQMLASNDFDPNGIVAQMLAQQRAVEAAKAAQAQKVPPKPQPRSGMESADETIRRRMREAGLE